MRRKSCGESRVWRLTHALQIAVILLSGVTPGQGRVQQVAVTGLVGRSVLLPCQVDETLCGPIHNIQWYRGDGDTRVFIFSELAAVESGENMLQGRGFFHYTKGSVTTQLEIRPLRADDESLYKCELTYLEVRESCAVIQFVNLTTTAEPGALRILLKDGAEVTDGSLIGPYAEGTNLTLTCEAPGGKPPATVTWWNNTVDMGGVASQVTSRAGTGVGKNVLRLRLGRHDLGARFECQATNAAVRTPLRSTVHLDMHVPPALVTLTTQHQPVVAGTRLVLTCTVRGARPAADVTWQVDGRRLAQQFVTTRHHSQSDGTTLSVSRHALVAERGADGRSFSYAPVVTVTPNTVIINESMDMVLFCSFDANPFNISSVTWYRDGRRLDLLHARYSGGTPDQPALVVRNASRRDSGLYRCEVTNTVGKGLSKSQAAVTVVFRPAVLLTISPSLVLEAERQDVTLRCLVADGAEVRLDRVAWYRDDHLLRKQPADNCTLNGVDGGPAGARGSTADFCGRDPAQLRLLRVDRAQLGSYRCADPPKNSALVYRPAVVLKGSPLTLTCDLDDPGYPQATRYIWMRGQHVFTDMTERTWNISSVSLQDSTNFSCVATNSAGRSGRIENGAVYSINSDHRAPDLRTNTLQTVTSTVAWNTTSWPEQASQGAANTSRFSCRTPPHNVSVTSPVVEVVEGEAAAVVSCSSDAFPEAAYTWSRDGETVQAGSELRLGDGGGVRRSQAGHYVCHAHNRHGHASADLDVRVLYAPECRLRQRRTEAGSLLVCQVDSAPAQLTFVWARDNQTVVDGVATVGAVSTLTAPPHGDGSLVSCRASSSLGVGPPCTLLVAGGGDSWAERMSTDTLTLAIAATGSLLLLLLLIGGGLLLLRRRRADKHGVSSHPKEREAPAGSGDGRDGPVARPVHKWPVRPGVQVHVSSVQSLSKLGDLAANHIAALGSPDKVLTLRRFEIESDWKEDKADGGAGSLAVTPPPEDRVVSEPGLGPTGEGATHRSSPPSLVQLCDGGTSRPSSGLSLNNSSGYGSSFSRAPPLYGSTRSTSSLQPAWWRPLRQMDAEPSGAGHWWHCDAGAAPREMNV
ncbi:hemicentin-2-like [Pollicipes pollicipes]|uniref:hemicentin-2-like n=1 Tax=Pollicipes pollicipes TaxID=41117 RepID=UPI00188576CD|nr:hemicentin-2-like [Pollicipes pollicipes]